MSDIETLSIDKVLKKKNVHSKVYRKYAPKTSPRHLINFRLIGGNIANASKEFFRT